MSIIIVSIVIMISIINMISVMTSIMLDLGTWALGRRARKPKARVPSFLDQEELASSYEKEGPGGFDF